MTPDVHQGGRWSRQSQEPDGFDHRAYAQSLDGALPMDLDRPSAKTELEGNNFRRDPVGDAVEELTLAR
ncbi:MAG: hypothetical protein KJ676_12670 [Alphaproteobacteria bacterium]|nr:hypothetical protein [Alphaproteobacteria bacterium]MBU1525340.1 hypothetical protein [Alphaproteobacteria bacterium]MBU2352295.1 hypothetical protein [Alphaproteobacteria bacterium]MBU2381653.1 hypothetical protein [Alphaproteobacteria bacterium]